jgi:hypothetical protein
VSQSRGIRNHNPGNIDHNPANRWQGLADPPIEQGVAKPRFARFVAPEWGIRAIARLLITYQDRHGLNTVRGLIDRWAPPVENNTVAYQNAVARKLGVGVTDAINVHDYPVMRELVLAIIRHENGVQPYSAAVIDQGLLLAGIKPAQPRPLLATKTVAGAATTAAGAAIEPIATFASTLTEAGQQTQAVATIAPWLQAVSVLLIVAGIALTIYGRASVRNRTGQ